MKRRSSPWCLPVLLVTVSAAAVGQVQFDELGGHLPSDDAVTTMVALGDVDGDGDLDLVLGSYFGRDRIYLNDGTGTFTDATAARMPKVGSYTSSGVLGDVDGDGDLDLVFGNSTYPRQNLLYINDSTGTFADVTAARMPIDSDRTFGMKLGDVDGDGDPDLVLGNENSQNRLYFNDGTGTFTDVTAARMPIDRNRTYAVALGDIDGDGDIDLIFGNGEQNSLYVNHAGVLWNFTSSRLPPDRDNTFGVVLGDVDGDGDLDLVCANGRYSAVGSPGQNRLYLNDGRGVFTDATAARMPIDNETPTSVALGDVDGDGDPDLVFGSRLLYLNDGKGFFTNATVARMPAHSFLTNEVAFGDLDGDGDVDLVFGNGTDTKHPPGEEMQRDRLYFNLHRQLDTPSLPTLAQTFAMDFYASPGYGSSFHTAIPVLNLSLASMPLSLPPLGDLYLDLNGVISLPWVAIPPSTGKGTLEVTVPADTALVGKTVYVQALIVNNARPWTDSHLTGYTADLIIK